MTTTVPSPRLFLLTCLSLFLATACAPQVGDIGNPIILETSGTGGDGDGDGDGDTDIRRVTHFKVASKTPVSITLSWQFDEDEDIDHFVIRRDESKTFTIDNSTRSFIDDDSSLTIGETYSYDIVAVKGDQTSPRTSLTDIELPAVAAADNLRVVSTSGKTVTLAWDDNGSGDFQEDSFTLGTLNASGVFTALKTLPTDTTQTSHTFADYGTYTLQIKTTKNLSFGYSNTLEVVLEAPPSPSAPAAASNLQAVRITQNNNACFRLTWTDNATNESSWDITYTYVEYEELYDPYDPDVSVINESTKTLTNSVNASPTEISSTGAREYIDCAAPDEFFETSTNETHEQYVKHISLRAKNAAGASSAIQVNVPYPH